MIKIVKFIAKYYKIWVFVIEFKIIPINNIIMLNAGIDFFNGSLTFMCIITAPIIKIIIAIEVYKFIFGIHMPIIKSIASVIFINPTIYMNHIGKP